MRSALIPALLVAMICPVHPAEVPSVNFTVTNLRASDAWEIVRVPLPTPQGLIPGEPPQCVLRGDAPVPAQATVITRHPDGSARRVMVSFRARLSAGERQECSFGAATEMLPAPALAQVQGAGAVLSLDGRRLEVGADMLSLKDPAGSTLAELRAFGPDLADAQPPSLTVLDNGPYVAWLRWRQDGSDYSREMDVQVDAQGRLRLTQRILRHLPENGWTPDFGFALTAPGAAPVQLPAEPVRFMGLPARAPLAQHPQLCASLKLADGLQVSLANPLALKQRRGTLEGAADGNSVRVRFSRLEPVEQEMQELQLQEGAWRTVEVVVQPGTPAELAAALDAPLAAKADWQAYDSVYRTGPPLEVEAPLLQQLSETYVKAIQSASLSGDDWGSLGGLERYNHCQYIWEDYFRTGDTRLRETALDYSENYRNFSVYWGPNPDYYGGSRYPSNDQTRPWPGSFRTRFNNAVTFCTKGYHTFWVVYEETGDPRFREAAEAQAQWSARHVHAGVSYTRCIGQVTDFVRMYEYTGRQEYLDQAVRLWETFKAVQCEDLLFTEGGVPATGNDLYVPDDRFGYAHPYVKSYIVQYATNALPDLLRQRPDDKRLRDTIIACNDWMARVQTAGGGWSYPGPTTWGFGWNIEYCHGLMAGFEVEPKEAYLDAIQRDLRAIAALYSIYAAIPAGVNPWEALAGMTNDEAGERYKLGTDRDRTRDFTDGQLRFGTGPDSTVYFQVLLRDYLKHRPEASLFTEDPVLDQIVRMPAALDGGHAQSGDPSLRISVSAAQNARGLLVRLTARPVYRLAGKALTYRWLWPDGVEAQGPQAERLLTRGGKHEVQLIGVCDGVEHVRRATIDAPLGPGDLSLETWPSGLRIQAESFTAQGGGASGVQLRRLEDKVNPDGGSISHWDPVNAWVEWTVDVPLAGRYCLLARYACPLAAVRQVSVAGVVVGSLRLPATGGYSSTADDWRMELLRDEAGKPLALDLTQGTHVLRLSNTDGRGCNLDYLELAPAPGQE